LEGYGDLQDVVERYKKRDVKKDLDKTQKYFFVSKKELKDNDYDLSLSKYKEETYKEVSYEKPKMILKKLIALENSIQRGLVELNDLM
jgi:type I restriction enzyme M protein